MDGLGLWTSVSADGGTQSESGLQLFWSRELETETTAVFIDELVMINDIYDICALEPGAQISLFTEESGWLDDSIQRPHLRKLGGRYVTLRWLWSGESNLVKIWVKFAWTFTAHGMGNHPLDR